MYVQTLACILVASLGGVVVIAFKSPGISQNQGYSERSMYRSQSSSFSSYSSSSRTSHSSSSTANTPFDCHDCHGDKCGSNSTYKRCPNPCPGTCGNPNGVPNCYKKCKAYGCECNPGYVVSDNDKCVKLDDCPDYLRCNDRYAIYKKYPNPCPATCAFPGRVPCNKTTLKYGCECKEGYVLNDHNKCVKFQDCPGAKACSDNETFVFCNASCLTNYCPVDDNRGIIACSPPFPCGSGCACIANHLRRREDNKCVLYSDCSPINCTRQNEIYSARPPVCLFDKCTDIGKPQRCDNIYPNKPQCICKPGFYRNQDDICVTKEQCYPTQVCGFNEIPVDCATICPPQNCDISYTEYYCIDFGSNLRCEPGCDCRPNHLRNASGICIPKEECPPRPKIPMCKKNEMLTKCKIQCPPQTCASLYTKYHCPNNTICEWGCDCIDGYLRNDSGVCIPSKQCNKNPPQPCGYNEVSTDCKIVCPPQTCDSIFTTYLCSNETVCKRGCDCIDGYLRNKSGICVPSEECFSEPKCAIAPECRPTCSKPEPSCRLIHLPSNTNILENQDGCQCKPGYILSDTNGVCIRIEECPDTGCNGDPNATVISCPWPCPSTCDSPNAGSYGHTCDPVGCQCKPGLILAEDSGKCILPKNCECGNPCGANGTFSECAFRCHNQYCPEDDSQVKVACKPSWPCPSGCLCKPYYLRKSYYDDTCVLASDCCPVKCTRPHEKWDPCSSECLAESCDDLISKTECYPDPKNCKPRCVCCKGYYRNKTGICVPENDCPKPCNVQQECRPTCAVPNPPNCPFIQPSETNDDCCNCQAGYVLSETGGKCIKIEDCPTNQTCNGDPHARIKECPVPCHSTYESPNATPCKRKCDPIGCECEPGYFKSETGIVLPDDCKAPVNCTRQCEKWNPCPSECAWEYCEAVDSPTAICNTLVLNCNPRCECQKSYFRNDKDICVSSDECCRLNKCKKVSNP